MKVLKREPIPRPSRREWDLARNPLQNFKNEDGTYYHYEPVILYYPDGYGYHAVRKVTTDEPTVKPLVKKG